MLFFWVFHNCWYSNELKLEFPFITKLKTLNFFFTMFSIYYLNIKNMIYVENVISIWQSFNCKYKYYNKAKTSSYVDSKKIYEKQ